MSAWGEPAVHRASVIIFSLFEWFSGQSAFLDFHKIVLWLARAQYLVVSQHEATVAFATPSSGLLCP